MFINERQILGLFGMKPNGKFESANRSSHTGCLQSGDCQHFRPAGLMGCLGVCYSSYPVSTGSNWACRPQPRGLLHISERWCTKQDKTGHWNRWEICLSLH